MNSLLNFITYFIAAFLISTIVALTRGDGKNLIIKIVVGTILITIILFVF